MFVRSTQWPKAGYLLNRWPSSLTLFESRIIKPTTKLSLKCALQWAGLPQNQRILHAFGLRKNSVHALLSIAARNSHSNSYHNPSHTEFVIRAAGLIGHAAGLPANYQAILVLAALIHDLDHQGKRARRGHAAQERYSFDIVKRTLLRYGVHARILQQLEISVLATYPGSDLSKSFQPGPSGDVVDCLIDADLFQSLFAKPAKVDNLTAKLKQEMMIDTSIKDMQSAFLAARRKIGLQSAAARWLHGALPKNYTYFNRGSGMM